MTIEETISNLRINLNYVNSILSPKLTEREYIRIMNLQIKFTNELLEMIELFGLIQGMKNIEKDELLDPVIKDIIEVDKLMKELIEC